MYPFQAARAVSTFNNIHLCYAAPREALPMQFVCTFWPLFLAGAPSAYHTGSHDMI
jgi:hypothetical protein